MFRFKSIILVLGLVACNDVDNKTTIPIEPKPEPIKIVNKTDSILSYADEKLVKIKESKIEQKMFVDSLQHTIEVEQYTINNLNKEVKRIKSVDETLQLTKIELEKALIRCKEKEEKLIRYSDSLTLVRQKLTNETVALVNFYTDKIETLEERIELLNDKLSLMEEVSEPTNKKKKKRRNGKNN